MTDAQKKVAAALAAVNAYLQDEQSLARQQEKGAGETQPIFPGGSPWALTGRQHMMSMRQLIQMKAFSRM